MSDLAIKYSGYVDEIFKNESKREIVTNKDFDFAGAHTVKIYKISTAEMSDYSRNSGVSRYGTPADLNATTETCVLSKDRSFTFVIDTLDQDETTRALNAATALSRQIREVVIPEIDSHVYATMCANAGTKPAAADFTDADFDIYEEILKASKELDDNEIPETNRSIIVTPAVYELMKKNSNIVMNTDIGEDLRLKGVISNLDGAAVIKVPAARLPEKFGFMMCHKSATCAPVKLENYNTHSNPPGISGDLVEGRIVYDAFVMDNKAKGIYYQATV